MPSRVKSVLFILAVFLFSFLIVVLNFQGFIYAGGDQASYLGAESFWKDLSTVWDPNTNYLTGGFATSSIHLVPVGLFFVSLSFLPFVIVEYVYFTLIFSGIFLVSYYFFKKYLFENNTSASLIAALSYIFNLFFFVSYPNYNVHLGFILFPLFLILCHEVVGRNKANIILLIVAISLLFPSAFVNPPAVIPIILVSFIYFFYLCVKNYPKLRPKQLILTVMWSTLAFVLLNIWWLYPYFYLILSPGAAQSLEGNSYNIFETTSLFDAFRFLGGWAFNPSDMQLKEGRYDFLYYNILIIPSYFIVFLALISGFFWKKDKNILFFLLLTVLGVALAKGNLPPFGFLYDEVFENIPGFFMFREPYTKFMIIHVLSISVLLGYSIRYIPGIFVNRNILKAIIVSCIFINAVPFIIGGFVPSQTQEGLRRSYLIKFPGYMHEYKKYMSQNNYDERIFLVPKLTSALLWPYGANISDMSIRAFTGKSIIMGKKDFFDHFSYAVVDPMYELLKDKDKDFLQLLGILNISQIHVQNDSDWRYVNRAKDYFPPSSVEAALKQIGLSPSLGFGKFSKDYLDIIPNTEKDPSIKNELYVELLDKPALEVYDVPEEFYLPRFYVPENVVYVAGNLVKITDLVQVTDYQTRSLYYFEEKANPDILKISDKIVALSGKTGDVKGTDMVIRNKDWSWPSSSIAPESPIYRLVKLKEEITIRKTINEVKRIDLLIWFAAKRVSEIKGFVLNEKVKKDVLDDYIELSNEAVYSIQNLIGKSNQNPDAQRIMQKGQRYLGESTLILHELGLANDEVNRIFDDYNKWIESLYSQPNSNCIYFFRPPVEGEYKLIFGNKFSDSPKVEEFSFQGDLKLELKCGEYAPVAPILNIDRFDKNSVLMLRKLDDWQAGREYLISFDYRVNKNNLIVSILEEKNDYRTLDSNLIKGDTYPHQRVTIFEQQFDRRQFCADTKSTCFSHYEKMVKATNDALGGYLYLNVSPEEKADSFAEIINLIISEKQDPLFVLERKDTEKQRKMPKIDIQKINSTRYRVKVSEATEAYHLVFSDSFDKDWRLFLSGSVKGNSWRNWNTYMLGKFGQLLTWYKSVNAYRQESKSYFGGDIIERSYKPIYIDKSTFDTWGMTSIADKNHRTANGFANVWYITPDDVGGLKDYELIVEFAPQRKAYVFLLISVLTLSTSMLYLSYRLLSKLIKKGSDD